MKTKEQSKAEALEELKKLYPEMHKQVIQNPGCGVDVLMDIMSQEIEDLHELAEEIKKKMEEQVGAPYEK